MNVDLTKTFSFSATQAPTDSTPWINTYDVQVIMRPITESHQEYNIAYQRMKFWFLEIMQDSVLIEQDHEKINAWRDTGIRCLDFPICPVDQVIGLMLMSKLTAMVEGRIDILQITVSSPADDFVGYICDQHDVLHWFDQPGWWKDPSPKHSAGGKKTRNTGKIITIPRQGDWQEHGLEWNNGVVRSGNVSMLPTPDRDD